MQLLIADKADILLVDDQVSNLTQLVQLLSDEYNVHPFTDATAALRYVDQGRPVDLVLLDVIMPGMDGYEMCRRLRDQPRLEDVPIVFLTGLDSSEDEAHGLALGAVDYITKPFSPPIVRTRVRNHVRLGRALRLIIDQRDMLDQRVETRTAELARKAAELQAKAQEIALIQDVTIVAMTSLAETRDNETGQHIRRTQNYVRSLSLALREKRAYAGLLDDETVDALYKSAPLHDIGKVAIPDSILLKPGPLTAEEFEVMKTHPQHGRAAIASAEEGLHNPNSFLHFAREIAYGHHEKWNGTGYPQGLSGTNIPLSARIMAVADVYDALISRRVYKSAMSHEQAAMKLLEGSGQHFDPDLIDTFMGIRHRFAEIAEQFRDDSESPH